MTKTFLRITTLLLTLATVAALAMPIAAQDDDADDPCFDTEIRTVTTINPFTGMSSTSTVEVEVYDTACDSLQDGRENINDTVAEAAIYCTSFGVDVYDLDWSGNGDFAFRATWAEIDAVPVNPAENTLIDGVPGFALYRLTSGELQVNGPADYEGKVYVFIWDGCARPEGR
jgi:hypothetical protein